MSIEHLAIVFFGAILKDYSPPEDHLLPESNLAEVFLLRSCHLPEHPNEPRRKFPLYAVALKESVASLAMEFSRVLAIDPKLEHAKELLDFVEENELQLEEEVRWILTTQVL